MKIHRGKELTAACRPLWRRNAVKWRNLSRTDETIVVFFLIFVARRLIVQLLLIVHCPWRYTLVAAFVFVVNKFRTPLVAVTKCFLQVDAVANGRLLEHNLIRVRLGWPGARIAPLQLHCQSSRALFRLLLLVFQRFNRRQVTPLCLWISSKAAR